MGLEEKLCVKLGDSGKDCIFAKKYSDEDNS